MQSKILEKILNDDNIKLKEIIDVIKENPVFNDVMSKVKEQYFIKDSIHGISHNERVALLACYIGIKEGLNNDELRLVLETAIYHDIGRGFQGNHGTISSEIIEKNKNFLFPMLKDEEIQIIKALCNGHSIDDKRYIEIAKIYGIENIENFKKLLNIVKDADSLDRVRLPKFGKLDTSFLRTTTAQNIPDIAELLYREYVSIQKQFGNQIQETEAKIPDTYRILESEKERLLFDGQNYYLIRSLNKYDIDSLDNGDGTVSPRGTSKEEYTVDEIINQVQMFRNKTGLISMSEDANVVLTYDRSNLHRFALVKIPESEIQNYKKVFPVGDYLLNVMNNQIDSLSENAPENVKQILSAVDKATSVQEIIQIINGANRQVSTSLIETEQQYLTDEEQLEQSKKIAKCKVLHYYGLMREVIPGKNISEYTSHMRMGYSSSEWLHAGKINSENIVQIPKILVETLSLLKQAEFQGIDKEQLKIIEQRILNLVNSGTEIKQENYQLGYSLHDDIKQELSIDGAFELTNGEISYRDTNIQMMAIRSLAEMTLNKRAILNFLSQEFPEIDVAELLKNTYCINPELITRINNKGNQLGKNVNLLIADYGYTLDDEISSQILSSVEKLPLEQLLDIIENGANSQEIQNILVKTRESNQRIQSFKSKSLDSKYIAEAIVEGYNWRKDGNTLTIKEKELLAQRLLLNITNASQLHTLYEAINKTQIGRNKFSQNEIFAIIINIAIDGKIGDISWKELLEKDRKDIQNILLDSKEQLQTSVLPISMDLLAGRGKEINKLKKELVDLGIDREFIESKDIKNVYVAKQIVESYDFGRDISQEEKKALLISVLNNAQLNDKKSIYLTKLMQNMEQMGLTTQEIYGTIINLGINGKVLEEMGFSYTYLLRNLHNSQQIIAQYKNVIQTEVSESTIFAAVINNISEKDTDNLKKELIALGIHTEFLEQIDIRNLYCAKQIVEGYNFRRDISQEEKRIFIISVLNNAHLKIKNTSMLTTLIKNFEQIGFNAQEIYGAIINLGISGTLLEGTEFSYSNLLENQNYCFQRLAQYKSKIQTKVTNGIILRALSENLNTKDKEKLVEDFIGLGFDRNFIESKDIKNVYIAKEIVEGYNFKRKLSQNEKRSLLMSVLKHKSLNLGSTHYLNTLIRNLEKVGLDTQEIYGMMLKIGAGERILEVIGYDYSSLLCNQNCACQSIAKYKNKIQTKVTNTTILRAQSENSHEIEKRIIEELIGLGIEQKFIEIKDIKNVYTAKQIVEGYNFEREISQNEKKALIISVLDNFDLNINQGLYLTTLIQNMEQVGFNTQEVYGMIINLGVNGKILEEVGYSYCNLLENRNNSCQTISKYKDRVQTKVSESTIDMAVINNLEKEEQENLKSELIDLGIDNEFINSKDIKNVYIGKQIVEEYNFGRDLDKEEKKALIISVLQHTSLNKKRGTLYLTTLIQNMEKMGFNTQEIYGMILNLGVNGKILKKGGYNYTNLLKNLNNTCQTIVQYKDEIQTQVTEGSIQKAVKKSSKQKKIKGQDIVQVSMDLLVEGKGGSEICDAVQTDYQNLVAQSLQKEGSEQDVPN